MAEQLESFFGVLKRQRQLRHASKNEGRPECPASAWLPADEQSEDVRND